MGSVEVVNGTAIVLTNGWLNNIHAKTAHGLLRDSRRFKILGLVDPVHHGNDAGKIVNNKPNGINIFKDIPTAISEVGENPAFCIVGVAMHGGKFPPSLRGEVIQAMELGMSIVCGLHTFLSDDPEFSQIARENNVQLIDVRKPRPANELRFWSGEIYSVKAPRIAMLGTDCALGKRTTGQLLEVACNKNGIKTELIYTGQTGWIQGFKHGFLFDSTVNDFIGGEIERVILECERESSPDLMLIEGQSSLRNPYGPCGSEFLLCGDAKGVILQHAPGRKTFDGVDPPRGLIPPIEEEIELISLYRSRTIAVTLNEENSTDEETRTYQTQLEQKLSIPVVRPLKEGVDRLLPYIREFITAGK